MVHVTPNGFPKTHRILKRSRYLEIQNRGQKLSGKYFIVLYLQTDPAIPPRLGITTTRKFGNAVIRNLTRRRVREAFRTHVFDVPTGIDMVVIPKKQAATGPADALREDLKQLGRRVTRALESQP